MPKVGKKVKKGQSLAEIESVKVVADVFAPTAGEIIKINDGVKKDPSSISKNANEQWIVSMKIAEEAELEPLMDETKYKEFLKTPKKH